MARKPTQRQFYDELLTRYGRELADAFLAAVDDLRSAADLQTVIARLAERNIEAAIAALHLDAAAYAALLETLRSSYVAGGLAAASYFPDFPSAAVIRFDVRNARAETWLSQHSSALVTRILDDQRAAVRVALNAGMQRGENPRTTALDIVGRINRATGQREGGILGLSAPQETFVAKARDELASSDPALLKNYLTRARRDKRFDRSVTKAIREETDLPAEVAGRALAQYKNRLMQLRGEMIGRTEALTSLRAAKHEAFVQAVERGAIAETSVRRTWRDVGDFRVRHTHRVLDGDTVGLREPFKSPSGARLMFPGDTSLGAGAAEVINCRCDVDYRIDFLANIG